MEESVYRKLQQHLDLMPVGFPKSESGADIRVLKAYFTPKEAEIAILLDFKPTSLDQIIQKCKQKEYSTDVIKKILISMDEKRLIRKIVSSNTKQIMYRNEPYAIGFFEWHVNRLTKEMADAAEEYVETYAKEFMGVESGAPQMRVIPLEAAITNENTVMNYDNVRTILESVMGPYVVSPCVCTQQKSLVGKPCKHNLTERCITNSKEYLERGDGREISKTELFDILDQAEQDGLVIQPGNSKVVGGFCLCCKDCCGVIRMGKMLEKPAKFFATNYYSVIDSDECSMCGTCLERCPMGAIAIEEFALIDLDRCIGCGVCVTGCPSNAISLKNKDELLIPPENFEELYKKRTKEKSKI